MNQKLLAAFAALCISTAAIAAESPGARPSDREAREIFEKVISIPTELGRGKVPEMAEYLAGEFRKRNDFSKSKGWIKDYKIFANVNPRDGEPDLYLVTVFDHMTTPAEDIQREKEMNAFMAQTTRQGAAGSAHRATYRKLRGDMLVQGLQFAR